MVKNQTELVDGLRELADKHGFVDVGFGVAKMLGISQTELDNTLTELKRDGYLVHECRLPSIFSVGKMRMTKVLCAPGISYKDIYADKVHPLA